MEDKVKNLQDNLKVLRMAAGMSATDLGKHLGVTRQMINSLENHRNNMTRMQYHAILHVLEEICDQSELTSVYPNSVLTRVYPILTSPYYTNEYKEYTKKGVLMYMPAYFSHTADMGDIFNNLEDYLYRFDGDIVAR